MNRSKSRRAFILPLILFVLCSAADRAWAAPASSTTSLAVTSSGSAVSTVASGTVITLTATVKAGSTAVKPGQVKFCDATASYCTDIHLLATAQLTATGTATFKFAPGIGSHSYKAIFVGTTSYATSASAAAALTVTQPTGKHLTATTIVSSGNPDNLTLTATVTSYLSQAGTVAPTGAVSFVDTSNGNKVLASANLGTSVASPVLRNSQTSAAGEGPMAVVEGDFNGDGLVDLASLNSFDNSVTIWLGNGDGTFRTGQSYTTGDFPTALATGDFNDDGLTDIAICNESDATVTVLLSNGDGTFTDVPGPATAVDPDSIVAGDFNGDGIADLAVANSGDPNDDEVTTTIFLGNGDGTFSPSESIPTLGNGSSFLAVGDFNGDGFPDLAVLSNYSEAPGEEPYSGYVTILQNDGTGRFGTVSTTRVHDVPSAITAVDVNGDGRADLFVGSQGGSFALYLNHGDGSFATPKTWNISGAVRRLSVADFNNDGKVDFAVSATQPNNPIKLYFGDGSGGFNLSTGASAPVDSPVLGGAADFNGDGIADIDVVSDQENGLLNIFLSQFSQTTTASASGILPSGAGTHQIEAKYLGDNNFSSSVSGTIALTVQPQVTLSATSEAFGNQRVNTQSATQAVTLTNTGNLALTISSIKLTGANISSFVTSNNCGSGLAIGAFCTISLSFDPQATGALTAALTVTDNAPNSPQSIALSGTGVYPPAVSLSATSVVFGNQQINTQSALQTVTLTNTGKGSLNISSTVLGGAHASQFRASNNCGTSVAAGASCTLNFRFYPENTGTLTATYTITDDAATSPQTIQLTGTGIFLPLIYLYPNHLAFGTQQVGVESDVQTVSLTNYGGQPLTFSTAFTGANGASFLTSNNCGTSVAVNASCTIRVRFDPTSVGAATAALTLTSNASNSPQSIALTGTGFIAPTAKLSATSIAFGNQKVNTESAAHAITLSNTGSQTLNISSIALTGAHPGQYLTSNNCGAGLSGGASCTINLRFHPRIPGSLPAALTITDNAANSPQSITLTGTGN